MAVNYETTSNIRYLGGDAVNDGVSLGKSTSTKVSLYGVTPVTQPSGTSQSAIAATTTTTATTTALETDLDAVRTLLLKIRADLVSVGIIKGSA